ncbi:MAG: hypothetical protein H6R18_114 [Proteobacteria bacterium]|nr:hypothetical protein [Pseudomonadota bacterium]
MSSLRIFVPAAEGSRIQWARLDEDNRITSQGSELQLVASDNDGDVELILAAERVLLIPATISAEQRARLSDDNLPWLAEPFLAQEVERVHIVKGDPVDHGRLPLCAVEHAWLAGIIARLAEKQIKPTRIVPEILLSNWTEGHWIVVLKSGGGFVRTGLLQGFLLDQAGEGMPPTVLMLALKKGASPEEIQVYCEDGVSPPNCKRWAVLLDVPVHLRGIWNWTEPIPEDSLDLARGAYSPPGRGRNLLRRLKPTLWLAAGIVALNIAALLVITGLGVMEKSRLNVEIEAQLRSAFPQTTVILDPMLQMHQNVDRLSRNAGMTTRSDFLPLLATVSATLGKEISGRIETLRYESGTLVLELSAPDAAWQAKLKADVAAAGLLAKWENLPASGNLARIRLSISS